MVADFYLKVWWFVIVTWPVWLPLFSVGLLFNTWISYKRRDWIKSQGSVLLEIKLPRDVDKSPAAMELVLNGLFEPIVGLLSDVYLHGRVRDWFSLEIASLGGEVKFFIWALPKWKNIIESRIYAQYPGAEVLEAKDYALDVSYDPEKMSVWGVTTKLNKPDAYPIKTYIDYELDKGDKEPEAIVDPLTPVLEYLGSLKSGEQAWIQIMFQAHRREGLQDAYIFSRPDWKAGIKQEIKNIIEKEALIKADTGSQTLLALTRTQNETIAAIERNAGKLAYDVMIRIVYTAPLEVFDRIKGLGLVGSMRQFGSQNLNGIRPDWFSGIDYPWNDFLDINRRENQRTLLDAYKRRSFFNVPYKHLNGKPYVLTTEELATLFHLPGRVATTPTLAHLASKRAEPPANLPV